MSNTQNLTVAYGNMTIAYLKSANKWYVDTKRQGGIRLRDSLAEAEAEIDTINANAKKLKDLPGILVVDGGGHAPVDVVVMSIGAADETKDASGAVIGSRERVWVRNPDKSRSLVFSDLVVAKTPANLATLKAVADLDAQAAAIAEQRSALMATLTPALEAYRAAGNKAPSTEEAPAGAADGAAGTEGDTEAGAGTTAE